jgi:hypothetical protein
MSEGHTLSIFRVKSHVTVTLSFFLPLILIADGNAGMVKKFNFCNWNPFVVYFFMIFIVQKLKAANCDVEMVVLVKAYFLF